MQATGGRRDWEPIPVGLPGLSLLRRPAPPWEAPVPVAGPLTTEGGAAVTRRRCGRKGDGTRVGGGECDLSEQALHRPCAGRGRCPGTVSPVRACSPECARALGTQTPSGPAARYRPSLFPGRALGRQEKRCSPPRSPPYRERERVPGGACILMRGGGGAVGARQPRARACRGRTAGGGAIVRWR